MGTLLTIGAIIFLIVGGYGSVVDSSKRDFHFGTLGGVIMILVAIYLIYSLFK